MTNKRKTYYDNAYNKMLSDGKLTGTVLDPYGILKGRLRVPGNYIWTVLDLRTMTMAEYYCYAGEAEDLLLRTQEHLKHWFFNDQEYHYLGIRPSELGSRYVLKLTAFTDPVGIAYATKKRRLQEERLQIEKYRPYTQYTEDISKKINPNAFDSCIWHKYRREAFLSAVANAG